MVPSGTTDDACLRARRGLAWSWALTATAPVGLRTCWWPITRWGAPRLGCMVRKQGACVSWCRGAPAASAASSAGTGTRALPLTARGLSRGGQSRVRYECSVDVREPLHLSRSLGFPRPPSASRAASWSPLAARTSRGRRRTGASPRRRLPGWTHVDVSCAPARRDAFWGTPSAQGEHGNPRSSGTSTSWLCGAGTTGCAATPPSPARRLAACSAVRPWVCGVRAQSASECAGCGGGLPKLEDGGQVIETSGAGRAARRAPSEADPPPAVGPGGSALGGGGRPCSRPTFAGCETGVLAHPAAIVIPPARAGGRPMAVLCCGSLGGPHEHPIRPHHPARLHTRRLR